MIPNVLAIAFILLGLALLFISGVGAIRLPDFYTRSHAIGIMDTIGTLLILLGVAFQLGISLLTLKVFFIIAFMYVANPTITHVLVRAALRSGLKPWAKKERLDT